MPAPGPVAFGRGVVVNAGAAVPEPWRDAPVVRIDEAVLAAPAEAVARLHRAWAGREPIVIELAVDPASFREPASVTAEPWQLDASFEPWTDRLHFLVWANTYDARSGEPVWWWGAKAARVEPGANATPEGPADVQLADATPVWIDGGPRQPWPGPATGGHQVVHAESVDLGVLALVPDPVDPTAELAPDQLVAVAHAAGPARVIAPAGSGKTRVLTERLRHLVRDRGYERELVLAVAYNKQAQLEMEARTAAFRPRVRTLNSLGLWVVGAQRGTNPALFEERDVRRLVEALLPGRRQRRSNTDPIGPYVEGLSAIRLGLRDPEEVEASRDDVPGLAELFPAFRARLSDQRAVDFDDQIYGAIEALVRDGELRRRLQRSCRHLLVDEFQDLTPAHVLLLRLLALPGLDVFGVGDDDQVIYGHAGADPGFLIDYGLLFPAAGEHALATNYRCAAPIVDRARSLLGYNHRRVPKEIHAAPDADASERAFRVVLHGTDTGPQALVDVVREWLGEPGAESASIAVLARVNSLLLAPHVALHEAGIRLQSSLRPDVLERTGLRAALAYLRIAASPKAINPADIVEVLRRPTRGLPQWFPDRLERRSTWTVEQVRSIASYVPDKDAPKVERLADDLELVVDAGRTGTTRDVLEAVRDDVGLGSAMSLLDRTGKGQGSSHLDDLEGLLGVADLHPELANFESWLRRAFQAEADATGVTLSTIHRVKGLEWDRVAVFGVADGVLPHRLSEDDEEERRVLHVAITRGRSSVAVLGDATRRSPFIDELAGTAPLRPARPKPSAIGAPGSRTGTRARAASSRYEDALTGVAADAEAALRRWRAERSKADAVPAYVVLNDKHLRGIAAALPSNQRELVACDGIGPAKLERYGDEILALLDDVRSEAT